jgi:hypothetical protein
VEYGRQRGNTALDVFVDDERVRPVTRTVAMDVTENGFSYRFPAHSLTILAFEVR